MTQVNDNINSRTGTHLTYEERVKIEAYKKLEYSNRAIAAILKRAPQTINNAVNQGTVRTIKQRQVRNGKVYEYDQYTYSADSVMFSKRRLWSICWNAFDSTDKFIYEYLPASFLLPYV